MALTKGPGGSVAAQIDAGEAPVTFEDFNPGAASGPTHTPGGDNREFYEDEYGNQLEQGGEDFSWAEMIYGYLPNTILNYAESQGWDPRTYGGWVDQQMPELLTWLDSIVYSGPTTTVADRAERQANFYQTPEGFQHLFQLGLNWFASRDSRLRGINGSRPRGGRGRGGGGSRGPSADEIRAQFDLDQLSDMAAGIWRGSLLEEPKNARDMAKAYVEEIVKNPKQKLDFETYIKKRVESSDRYASIYRNKPEGMDAPTYIQRYYQSALQFLRPRNAEDVAIQGAQFGADPNAFRGLVNRQDETISSTPFISKIEDRMTRVRGVLRG